MLAIVLDSGRYIVVSLSHTSEQITKCEHCIHTFLAKLGNEMVLDPKKEEAIMAGNPFKLQRRNEPLRIMKKNVHTASIF